MKIPTQTLEMWVPYSLGCLPLNRSNSILKRPLEILVNDHVLENLAITFAIYSLWNGKVQSLSLVLARTVCEVRPSRPEALKLL